MATAQAYLSAPPTEVRPRLTKEQHDILERHFQGEKKPTTATKKSIAESLEVPLEKINVKTTLSRSPLPYQVIISSVSIARTFVQNFVVVLTCLFL